VVALDGVTVGVPSGIFTAVMVPSGSGKSTLLQCAAGLDLPTEGDWVATECFVDAVATNHPSTRVSGSRARCERQSRASYEGFAHPSILSARALSASDVRGGAGVAARAGRS
jgi:ABC-type polar amino acid transport system ATPase subunit